MSSHHLCHIPLIRSKSRSCPHSREGSIQGCEYQLVGIIGTHFRVYSPHYLLNKCWILLDSNVKTWHWGRKMVRFKIFAINILHNVRLLWNLLVPLPASLWGFVSSLICLPWKAVPDFEDSPNRSDPRTTRALHESTAQSISGIGELHPYLFYVRSCILPEWALCIYEVLLLAKLIMHVIKRKEEIHCLVG